METGLTFLEFNYMLMQSYDFLQWLIRSMTAVCRSAATTSGAICFPAPT